MSQVYISRQGDVLDEVAFKFYGTLDGRAVERLLEANPGLADYPERLPAGVRIDMVDLPQPAAGTKRVKLWD